MVSSDKCSRARLAELDGRYCAGGRVTPIGCRRVPRPRRVPNDGHRSLRSHREVLIGAHQPSLSSSVIASGVNSGGKLLVWITTLHLISSRPLVSSSRAERSTLSSCS